MGLKNLRDKIQERVEKSAWTLSGMKAYEKVRVELVIWAFIFFYSILGLFYSILASNFHFRAYIWLFMIGISCLAFLGKSFQFRHFYMLNKIKEAQNE